jgi:hypothetical protein
VKQVVGKYITIKRRGVELDRASIKLELPDFLELYDPVNVPVVPATVPSSSTPDVRISVFADCAGPFNCTLLQGDVLPKEPRRCTEAHDVISLAVGSTIGDAAHRRIGCMAAAVPSAHEAQDSEWLQHSAESVASAAHDMSGSPRGIPRPG